MTNYNRRLTLIFDEAVKAARNDRLEMATYLLQLLPPREQLSTVAHTLLCEIERIFGIKANIGSPNALGRVDFLTGKALKQNSAWPKISVITPSYNQGKYIRETINSVISQKYPNLEYIVIDGGSTDETLFVIKQYEHEISYWVSERDKGQSNAINKGFQVATGEILTWLNSDDQFANDALFHMALAFITSEADMVAGICEVHENGALKHRHMTSCSDGKLPVDAILDLEKGWNAGQFFFQPEVFFKRSLWEKAGAHVREDCYYSMDYELWCRFAAVDAKIHVIGAPIINFRSHPEQKTADPDKFRAELVHVQKKFVDEWLEGNTPLLDRPGFDSSKRIRVTVINDHGFKYGAGIAHQRIAAALDLAGFHVHDLSINKYLNRNDDLKTVVSAIMQDLSIFAPDIVIFGNLHSQWKKEVELIYEVQKKYNTFWLTHDFWLFTGRCPYVSDCGKYLTGCDHHCPTADDYPVLPRQQIYDAWKEKRKLLEDSTNLTILANSHWAKKFSENYLASFKNRVRVERIILGVPVEDFFKVDKAIAKKKLKIEPDTFTIAFSVSSVSEKRKGADFLVSALHILASENITLLLIGNCDEALDLPDVSVVKLGYVESTAVLVDALNASDIFVGPSREETLGQVFLEAAMCGTPSIGFAGSGVEDAIIPDVTGILIEENSAVQLAAAIKSLIDDTDYLTRLSRTAYLHARNHFSLEACFRSFYQVFKKQGLIDQWTMPHKISFSKCSALLHSSRQAWSAVKGLSLLEGPYPEHGLEHAFRWCHGEETIIEIEAATMDENYQMTFQNILFDMQELRFLSENSELETLILAKGETKTVSIHIVKERASSRIINIVPSKFLDAPDSGGRRLSTILLKIEKSSQ